MRYAACAPECSWLGAAPGQDGDKRTGGEKRSKANGGLSIATAGGPVALRPWETGLVPAAADVFTFAGAGEALIARVAPDLARLRERALPNGIGAAAFDAFATQFSGVSQPA